MNKKIIASPCKKICKLIIDKTTGKNICEGCGRTLEEIKYWSIKSDKWRKAVLDRLEI